MGESILPGCVRVWIFQNRMGRAGLQILRHESLTARSLIPGEPENYSDVCPRQRSSYYTSEPPTTLLWLPMGHLIRYVDLTVSYLLYSFPRLCLHILHRARSI